MRRVAAGTAIRLEQARAGCEADVPGCPEFRANEGTPGTAGTTPNHGSPHAISLTGLEPRFITAELTLANVNPAMAELIALAEQSLAEAERAIDALWTPVSARA